MVLKNATVLIAVSFLFACGDFGETLDPFDGSPEGNTVTGPNGVTIEVPAGAIDEEVEIGISVASKGDLENLVWTELPTEVDTEANTLTVTVPGFSFFQPGVADENEEDGVAEVGPAYEVTPHGQVFKKPVVVTIPYDESQIAAGKSENELSVFHGADSSADCQPDCTGLECGADPVCGESCGTCLGSKSCKVGKCFEGPCVPDCSSLECGPDPVCGESCGTCSGGKTCQAGQCVGGSTGDTWTDPTSGLTWQVTPTGGTMNWSDATAHCSVLSLDGGGWHLPTIGELRALIRGCPGTITGGACGVTDACLDFSCDDEGCRDCSSSGGPADGCYWPDGMQGTCSEYWSSSAVATDWGDAWGVDYIDGDVIDILYPDSIDLHVRCVR